MCVGFLLMYYLYSYWSRMVLKKKYFLEVSILQNKTIQCQSFWGVEPHDILQTELTKKK